MNLTVLRKAIPDLSNYRMYSLVSFSLSIKTVKTSSLI
jgi:hypothetical protein